jgi:hypothetical protein
MHTYSHACMQKLCMHTYQDISTYILAYVHANMRAYIHTQIHTYIHERTIPEPLAVQRGLMCAACPKPACQRYLDVRIYIYFTPQQSLVRSVGQPRLGTLVTGQCAVVTSSPSFVSVIVTESAESAIICKSAWLLDGVCFSLAFLASGWKILKCNRNARIDKLT